MLFQEKNINLVKRSKIINQQPKSIENPNIVEIKSVIIEYPKTSHKLSEALRQAEKVSQEIAACKNFDSFLYSKTKLNTFWMETRTQKQKQLLMKVTLMMYLNQSIVLLDQTYNKSLRKGSGQITDLVT